MIQHSSDNIHNVIASLPLDGTKTLFYFGDVNVLSYQADPDLLKRSLEFRFTLFSFFRGVRILKALRASLSPPKHLFVEPSRQCNLACAYCYARSGPEFTKRLDIDKIYELIDRYGFDVISFLGGEPLMDKIYFRSVFEHGNWKSFFVSTNGILVDKSLLDLTESHKELSFQVSIEPEEWGSRVTRDGTKQITILERRQRDLPGHHISFRVTIPRTATYVPLKNFIDRITEYMGSDNFDLSYWPATGKDLPTRIDRWIDESYTILKTSVSRDYKDKLLFSNKFESYDQKYHRLMLVGASLTRGVFSEEGTRYFFCNAGHGSVAVGPDGKLHMCHSNAINESTDDIVSSLDDPLEIAIKASG